mgnify:CR=1 FL=1
MYLLLTTRLTVLSCMPMSSATSFRTSGRMPLDAVVQELALVLDDRDRDLVDRALPLLEALDQAERRAELVAHVFLGVAPGLAPPPRSTIFR